jgi:hypothetical protein
MSDFYDAIEAEMDKGTDVICRRLFDFYFAGTALDGKPNRMRLWEGNGRLFAGGHWWTGFYIGDQAMMEVPELSDGREGEAPALDFRIGFLSKEVYDQARANQDVVKDRLLIIWRCYIARGEGLRAITPPGHPTFLTMKSAEFEEDQTLSLDGLARRYVAGIIARGPDEGRSYAPGDTVTDVNQRKRAMALAGVENDAYARMVPLQKNRKLTLD